MLALPEGSDRLPDSENTTLKPSMGVLPLRLSVTGKLAVG